MGREKEPFQRRWHPQDARRREYEDEYEVYEDDLEDDEDDEYEFGDRQEVYEKGSKVPKRRPETPLPPFPSTTKNIYPRTSRAKRMPESTTPRPPKPPMQTTRSMRQSYPPDEPGPSSYRFTEPQPSTRRPTGPHQRSSQQTRRTNDFPHPSALKPVSSQPRKRKVWPIFLIGCAAGAVSLVLAAAIIVLIAIRSLQGGGNLNIPGFPNNDKAITGQPETQTKELSALSQLIVCNPAGNISLKADQNITSPTVTTTKTVHAADQNEANQKFRQISISVETQPPSQSQKPPTCQKPQVSNASALDTTPTATPTASNNTVLSVNVTFPPNQAGQTPTVDVTIMLPESIVQTDPAKVPLISVEAPVGNINTDRVSGTMILKSATGDIAVQHAVLFNGSHLSTEGNITFKGGLYIKDTTPTLPSEQPQQISYHLDCAHQLDVTLPESTNVFVDAWVDTNTGKILSDFFKVDNSSDAHPVYKGPLNPKMTTPIETAPKLSLHSTIGSISIHKA